MSSNKNSILFKSSSIFTVIFSLLSLLTNVTSLFSRSLVPISILIGVPLTSLSANLKPGDFSESSTLNVMLFSFNLVFIISRALLTEMSLPIGIISTFIGATFGGRTSP